MPNSSPTFWASRTGNFAIGGARLYADRTIGEVLDEYYLVRWNASPEDVAWGVDYRVEAERFVAQAGGEDLSNTAISVLIGLNDARRFEPPDAPIEDQLDAAREYGAGMARATVEQTQPAIDEGVGTVILNTLPDVRGFPIALTYTEEERANGSALVEGYNAELEDLAEDLEGDGVNATVLELGVIFEEVVADAPSFNFRDPAAPVYYGDGALPIPNPSTLFVPRDQIIFFDEVHPTREMHEVVAAYQAASLTSEVTIGDEGGEDFTGSGDADLFVGRAGDDTATLRTGDDIALGGRGDDTLSGNLGEDLLIGGSGDDSLFGGFGDDILADGEGDDRLAGSRDDDLLIVGAGADTVRGGAGDDVFVWTEPSLVGIDDDGERDILLGGPGYDTLVLRVEWPVLIRFDDPSDINLFRSIDVISNDFEEIIVVRGYDDVPLQSDQLADADLWHLI